MDHRFARIALTAVLALGIVSSSAYAADKKTDGKQDAMMEAMMKMAMPGPMHDLMKPMAGSFKATTKTWMAPGEPMISEGTSENTWILGNRYLQTTFRGQMAGMPFEGFGLMGYDNMKKEFVSCWADNMGTGIAFSDGTADGSGKVLTMSSMMDDPTSGKQVPVKMITKVTDENQYMMTMSSMKDGKEHLDMEITYTRMK